MKKPVFKPLFDLVNGLKSLPGLLGERVFPLFLTALALGAVLGVLVFARYYLTNPAGPLSLPERASLQTKKLDHVLQILEERQKNLQSNAAKTFPDLFEPRK